MSEIVKHRLGGMLNRQRLPLADPSPNSLGRLYGQYPALTDVDGADDIRVIFVTADLTAFGIWGPWAERQSRFSQYIEGQNRPSAGAL
jgi:hypothetical protein